MPKAAKAAPASSPLPAWAALELADRRRVARDFAGSEAALRLIPADADSKVLGG